MHSRLHQQVGVTSSWCSTSSRWHSESIILLTSKEIRCKTVCCNSVWCCTAGMIPLARELIKNGTFVVLAANEVPALNDITAEELKVCTTGELNPGCPFFCCIFRGRSLTLSCKQVLQDYLGEEF